MLERHELEQYFWDAPTLQTLANVAARFDNPCCLRAPMLGRVLNEHQIEHRVLDFDERFAEDENYAPFDLYRPQWRDETFGVIICDPPFWKVSLSQLFAAIRLLSHYNFEQPLAICYPTRRAQHLRHLRAFRSGADELFSWLSHGAGIGAQSRRVFREF